MTSPAVSVVMTAYNGEAYIAEAIEGVLSQSFTDFELLVVDDGSSDRTVEIIQGFKDARLRLVQNERNLGISNSRNRGNELACGRYLAAHDQDDISYPDRLRHQVAVLEADPETVLVCGRVDAIPSRNEPWPSLPVPSPPVLAWSLFTGSKITHSTICLRRSVLREQGIKYEQRYHYAEDFELFHKLGEVGKLVMLPSVLGAYRHHDRNASRVKHTEMTANGQAFLRERYNEYLGAGSLSQSDMASVWGLLIDKRAAASAAELERVGSLISRLVDCFIERRGLGAVDAEQVYSAASEKWQETVTAAAREHGPSFLRFASAYPNLAAARTRGLGAVLKHADVTARYMRRRVARSHA